MTEHPDARTKKAKAGIDSYMAMGVKPLIEAFPEVGQILERYGIGCVPCTVGTCKLKEVVKLHALSPQDEAKIMFQIERVVYKEVQ